MKEQHKYIGNVRLDYTFFSGFDSYSDGDVEDELLQVAQNEELNPGSMKKMLDSDTRWPVLYHFSPIRGNIIEWYPFSDGCSVLEIGSGCGAVTGTLCKKADSVTCIELSEKRSLINANRHRNHKLEIILGNFNDIEFDRKFDYITLIGVLEYARMFFDQTSENPFSDLLVKIKRLLNHGGSLIIAIENKFGLKYWAGAKEDHTGIAFEGIEGYPTTSEVLTFSKNELLLLLKSVGYENIKFFYPYPDYKMPTCIYSDDRLPQKGELGKERHNYDLDRVQIFNEANVYSNLIASGMFDLFSNSFLVIAKI